MIEPSSLGEPLDPLRDVAVEGEAGVVEPVLEHGAIARAGSSRGRRRSRRRRSGCRRAGSSAGATASPSRPRGGKPQEPLVEGRVEHERLLDEVDDLVELAERVAPLAVLGRAPPRSAGAAPRGRARRRRARIVSSVGAGARDRDGAVGEAVAVRRVAGRDAVQRDRRPSRRRASRRSSAPAARSADPGPSASTSRTAAPGRRREALGQHLGERAGRAPRARGSRRAPRARPASTPCRFAKPAAAFSRSATGGPLSHSSAVRSGRSSTRTTSRRGPTQTLGRRLAELRLDEPRQLRRAPRGRRAPAAPRSRSRRAAQAAARSSTYSSATARARLRTRPM